MQERRNFIDNTLESHLSCTNPSICDSQIDNEYKFSSISKTNGLFAVFVQVVL